MIFVFLFSSLLSGLSELHELYLDNNNLHTIHVNALDDTNLHVLHLQHNFLDFVNIDDMHIIGDDPLDFENVSPFQSLHKLQVLNMRNNSMRTFLSDWSLVNIALIELDLGHNRIEELNFFNILNKWTNAIMIDVSNNNITTINAHKNGLVHGNQSSVTWNLNDNPLKCDCVVIYFAKHLQMQTLQKFNTTFIVDELKCSSPDRFVNQQLQNVPLNELTCPMDNANAKNKRCPEQCSCYVRTVDRTAVFNCSNANLTEIPALPNIKSLGLQFYELYIENNNISTFTMANTTGFANVSRIFAKNNSVEEILPEHLPNNLFALDLSGNKLKRIKPDVLSKLSHMQNLQNVSISQNPWICDCAAYELMKFIETHFTKMVGVDQITCDNNNTPITRISSTGLCPIQPSTIVIICISIALMVAVLVILSYEYRLEIMVWLFAHNISWFFDTKPNSHDHKKYDAFVLCATTDEEFVEDNLIPPLECGPNALKVCTLMREIKAGEIIGDKVNIPNRFIYIHR